MHPRKTPEPLPERRSRVRFRRLEQLDESKVALAISLMAKRLVEAEAPPAAENIDPGGDELAERRREVA